MFTGIVEEVGTARSVTGERLVVGCHSVLADTRVGDSIAVDGVCLTVTELLDDGFAADVMGETFRRTALADLLPGTEVNLERAVRADGRLGGHLVQGHVDGVAEVVSVTTHGEWTIVGFSLPPALAPFVAEKGSVTVDGVSLTVTTVGDDHFEVGLVPHTLTATTLGRRRAGDRVNIEVDMVARYLGRLLAAGVPGTGTPRA